MPASGPFLSGSFSQNNRTSITFSPSLAIPAGALIWLIAGTDVADTETVTVTDSAGNEYVNQVFVAPPGVPGTILVAVARNAIALPTSGSVTLSSSARGNFDGVLYHHTGARGEIFSTDIQYFDTGTTPVARCYAQAGMTLFGTVAVRGPSADGFTPDPNWGPDQKINIQTTNVTVHASGRVADARDWFTYAPVLGNARRSLIFAGSFF